MTAFLEIYLSSFWAWAGITFGVYMTAAGLAEVINELRGGGGRK